MGVRGGGKEGNCKYRMGERGCGGGGGGRQVEEDKKNVLKSKGLTAAIIYGLPVATPSLPFVILNVVLYGSARKITSALECTRSGFDPLLNAYFPLICGGNPPPPTNSRKCSCVRTI